MVRLRVLYVGHYAKVQIPTSRAALSFMRTYVAGERERISCGTGCLRWLSQKPRIKTYKNQIDHRLYEVTKVSTYYIRIIEVRSMEYGVW